MPKTMGLWPQEEKVSRQDDPADTDEQTEELVVLPRRRTPHQSRQRTITLRLVMRLRPHRRELNEQKHDAPTNPQRGEQVNTGNHR